MGFGGSQNKNNMWWWFLKGFKQGVRGVITEHVDFVYDVDLITGLVGGIVDLLTEVSNIINTGVTSGVNFDDIQRPGLGDCLAYGAGIARLTLAVVKAVYCFSQDTPGASLAGSPWATEKIGMRYMATTEGVA